MTEQLEALAEANAQLKQEVDVRSTPEIWCADALIEVRVAACRQQELRQATSQQESVIADLNTEIAAYENHAMELKRTLEATAHACRTHENELVQKRATIEVLEQEKSQVQDW